MSQLLCEQVVGRGLRRASYEAGPDGKFSEEVAQVFGVPFEVIPFKANPQGPGKRREKRYHVNVLHEDRTCAGASQGEAPEVPRYEASRGPGSTRRWRHS